MPRPFVYLIRQRSDLCLLNDFRVKQVTSSRLYLSKSLQHDMSPASPQLQNDLSLLLFILMQTHHAIS